MKMQRIRIRMRAVGFPIIAILLMLVLCYMVLLPHVWREQIQMKATGLHQYVHPHNLSIKGIKFKMSTRNYNLAMQLIAQLEGGKKVETLTMDSLVEAMTPVTAVSSNHLHELLKHLDNFHQFVPDKRLIVYDLGLTRDEVFSLKRIDYVEYRNFDFSVYPKHTRHLDSYAWKPLIIQQVLAEQGGVMWLDSSVKISKPYTKVLEQMVNKSSGFLYYLAPNGHSILSVTHPKMLEYLPMKNVNEKQPQASGFLVFNTPEIRKFLFKWATFCSLVQDCIAPKGSTKHCSFNSLGKQTVVGCHRYDQSMFSILVSNQFSPDRYLIDEKLGYPAIMERLGLTSYQKVVMFLKLWLEPILKLF